jgi:hypothetical protein
MTVDDLERWTDHGAIWKTLEVSDELAVVQLCTCYGEPVDVVESEKPELIAYVRAQRETTAD